MGAYFNNSFTITPIPVNVSTFFFVHSLTFAAAAACAFPCGAQTCLDTAGFVRVRGGDTLVVEKVEVTSNGLIGVQRSPDGVVRYDLTAMKGGASQMGVNVWRDWQSYVANSPASPDQTGWLILDADTVIFTARSGDRSQVQRDRISRGTVPLLDVATGLEERLLRRVRQRGEAAADVPTYYVASGGYSPVAHVTFVGRDSANLRLGSDLIADFRIDSAGRVIRGWYRTRGAVDPVRLTRVPCDQVDAILRSPH